MCSNIIAVKRYFLNFWISITTNNLVSIKFKGVFEWIAHYFQNSSNNDAKRRSKRLYFQDSSNNEARKKKKT